MQVTSSGLSLHTTAALLGNNNALHRPYTLCYSRTLATTTSTTVTCKQLPSPPTATKSHRRPVADITAALFFLHCRYCFIIQIHLAAILH
ncbi:hypothetical protein B296_00003660 [Ensete ventricosum]|uniref:Uncharacterized protein n=1 Tax=Ensete ventricosum TaxID=4639 RepID=A0A427B1Y5_ENSVE|nr:hypothetical protein B296_00003660 [Ensete ventricosum]